MKNYTTIAATTLVAAMTGLVAAPSVAHAVTLLDLLRGGPANQSRSPAASLEREAQGGLEMGDPEPLPRVTGPRYYTYKPEAMRRIQITLRSPEAASAVAAENGADSRRFLAEAKVSALPGVAEAVEAYYGNPAKPFIWITATGPSDKARQMLDALAQADTVGLSPEDYVVALPSGDTASDGDQFQRELVGFEVALSAAVLTYVADTERGRIDPNKISGYYDFKRKTVNLSPVLDMLRLSPDVAAYLRNRDPDNIQFVTLRNELARLRAEDAADAGRVEIKGRLMLKPGQSSAELPNVMAALKAAASDALKAEHGLVLDAYDGSTQYTNELAEVIKDFQEEQDLKPDGVVGPATVRALTGHSNEEKIKKLVVALEQLRWLPADLGDRYVFINQPAYQAYYFEGGREQLSMRVVVGSKANQTYFFQDQIQTVEFNPYWGVPKSIIVNEMLPKLRQDPGYLDRLGYEVSYGGKRVASSEVNWNTTHAVNVRQPPGSDNALGELKILFPNDHAIYMHDTPSKSYFNRDMRALSHGCVRLSEPRVMAAAVMGTTVEDIGRQIASGQNRAVQVPQKIPVYVSYFTAWPNKDGIVEYFDDVYERDSYTAKAFAATGEARGT
ncbi:L,D-transpeptidase family protein [Peteryoungia desertarenae]